MTEDRTSSHSSGPSSLTSANLAVTTVNIPIVTISTCTNRHEKSTKLPKLPSNRYRYTNWYELRGSQIKGNELNNPRIRKAPDVKEKIFQTITDEHGKQMHHGKKGKERDELEKRISNWENSQAVNLSYQQLGEPYQVDEFLRTLKRLIRAERIQLIDNSLEDINKVTFRACTVLNLNTNHFKSFTKLPKCPNLNVLHLCDNSIDSFSGLERLTKSRLVALDLRRNPICFMEGYRQRIFSVLPDLRELDGIPRMTSDIDLVPPSGCALS